MFNYPYILQKVFDELYKIGAKPIIIGGFVRDNLLGLKSKDIDVEVYHINSFDALKTTIAKVLRVDEVGKSFGVCKAYKDGYDFDFSLPRIDSKTSKGHKGFRVKFYPDIDYKTAFSRRDFTINAIGYNPLEKSIIDPFDGQKDLKNNILKMVDKDKFKEDPLRILRAMQFCARFELDCDDELIFACKEMIKQDVLCELSNQRIFEEFKKLFLKSKNIKLGFEFLQKIDAKKYFNELCINDELLNRVDCFNKNKSTNDITNITVMLALVCYDMSDDKSISFLEKISAKRFYKNINILKKVGYFLQNKTDTIPYNLAKEIDITSLKLFLEALHIKIDISDIKPKIHGKDLLKNGLKPSKEFSSILDSYYQKQLYTMIR